MADFLLLYVVIIGIASVVILLLLPRYGPHSISRLTCPKCKKKFNYHWVPGASFIQMYHRNTRSLRCPYCHQIAIYDIRTTRLSKEQIKILKSKPAIKH